MVQSHGIRHQLGKSRGTYIGLDILDRYRVIRKKL